jgi:3-dehydroquinate dehydratase-2
VGCPVIETHITNIHAREEWRRHSYVSLVAKAVICGFGIQGYALAIAGIAAMGGPKSKR